MTDRLAQLAALADAHRLALVDVLAAGDLSPAELGRAVDLPSNLLAHHLRVLEDAGLVDRRRSDGDGRRAYLSLRWSPLVAAAIATPGAPGVSQPAGRAAPDAPAHRPSRVLFVCTGNAARSPLAAALAAAAGVPAASAGVDPAASLHPGAVAELARHGLTPLADTPAPLDQVRAAGDLVITVCDRAHESGAGAAHWSIPRPDGTAEAFARIVDQLTPRVRRLADALTTP
ncbi:helix-turn-helix domain-containing protein [Demequina sp. SYSU T00039]|uniref:Helix-turn-helix domain-containing protein n=1 Tax=Demequina lignilytica TaxID=3051663 RepID=A0AAW7M1D6_9MICO|nr:MULTISPECIES: helix-turn-helix domain-containing protein [unclassified Demequina]MDN4477410.1 helix-turn-helix domain-containing protein [Demequina sp. SYSU T00039-1]MDN4488239.1 helix-turn-helix domain-containing protein [Demequina sp. SYSU T00039]